MSQQLKFGQTPFDHLRLRQLQMIPMKMYLVLCTCDIVFIRLQSNEPYWTHEEGSGKLTLAKMKNALTDTRELFDSAKYLELSFDNLRVLACKLYSALLDAGSVLSMTKHTMINFAWRRSPLSDLLNSVNSTIEDASAGFDSENIYRAFFRYADAALFSDEALWMQWHFCPKCKAIFDPNEPEGTHLFKPCDGRARALTLDDIKLISGGQC